MTLVRVDNRLVHGQIIEAWLPYLGAKHLVVVNDALLHDALRQQIMSLAVPQRIQIHFIGLAQWWVHIERYATEGALFLLENIQDLQSCMLLYTAQTQLTKLPAIQINIGNVPHGFDKRTLMPSVSVTESEWRILEALAQKYMVDFRSLPSEKTRVLHELF